jgi:hypothetical protein
MIGYRMRKRNSKKIWRKKEERKEKHNMRCGVWHFTQQIRIVKMAKIDERQPR